MDTSGALVAARLLKRQASGHRARAAADRLRGPSVEAEARLGPVRLDQAARLSKVGPHVATVNGGAVGDIWDDLSCFESFLSQDTLMAALQLLAELFTDYGFADALDIKVDAVILQQVSSFHVPVKLLLEAVQKELDRKSGPFGCERVGVVTGTSKSVPADFVGKATVLEQKVQSASTASEAALNKLSTFAFDELNRLLTAILSKDGILAPDALDTVRRLRGVRRAMHPLAETINNMVRPTKMFAKMARTIQEDLCHLDDGELSMLKFWMDLEGVFRAAKDLALAVHALVTASTTFVDAAKALVESVDCLVIDLKETKNEHVDALEAQLVALKELPTIFIDALSCTSFASKFADKLMEDLATSAGQAVADALNVLLGAVEGNVLDDDWQETLRGQLITSMAGFMRMIFNFICDLAIGLARSTPGGHITETVGFHFDDWLKLQFTVVIDMSEIVKALQKIQDGLDDEELYVEKAEPKGLSRLWQRCLKH